MTETEPTSPATPMFGSLQKRLVIAVALVLGICGALSGDAKYEDQEIISRETVPEKVLVACEVKSDFRSYKGISRNRGARLSAEICEQEIKYLSSPLGYLDLYYKSVATEKDVVTGTISRRDWTEESKSRALRALGWGFGGAVLASVLLVISQRVSKVRENLKRSIGERQARRTDKKAVNVSINQQPGGTEMTQVAAQPTAAQSRRARSVRITATIVAALAAICGILSFIGWLAFTSEFGFAFAIGGGIASLVMFLAIAMVAEYILWRVEGS